VNRWLVRFGYDGRPFGGWARQPGLRTVEGELLRGTVDYRAPGTGIAVASRTDRGVSARANALILQSPLEARPLLRALNGIAPEIFCTAATSVGEGFRVRRADRRIYRYFERAPSEALERWRTAGRRFSGEIDVRSLGRGLPTAEAVWRTVERVNVRPKRGGLIIEVRAPSFVWGMVRKMVAAMRAYAAGNLDLARLEAALRGERRLALPMAEPEPLVLWTVEFPVRWKHRWNGPTRAQRAYRERIASGLWARAEVLASWPTTAGAATPDVGPAGPARRR
jgi:tRNA pseudouridine38-40 synthase